MKVITKDQALMLHRELIAAHGGSGNIRDGGLLDSAISAPFQTFGGQPLLSPIKQQTTRLGYGIIMNHPFVDGNKRAGAHIMLTFLAINGIELRYTQKELYKTILGVAAGEMPCDELMHWIVSREE